MRSEGGGGGGGAVLTFCFTGFIADRTLCIFYLYSSYINFTIWLSGAGGSS